MTKPELIKHIAIENKLTQQQVKNVLDSLSGFIALSLLHTGRFEFKDVGTFSIKEYSARTGRNPRTGESIVIQSGSRVKFKVAKNLKEKVL